MGEHHPATSDADAEPYANTYSRARRLAGRVCFAITGCFAQRVTRADICVPASGRERVSIGIAFGVAETKRQPEAECVALTVAFRNAEAIAFARRIGEIEAQLTS